MLQGIDVGGFSASIIQKAKMRLHDFSSVLRELADPQLNNILGKQPLLQVDKAIYYKKLTAEQISQLLNVLQKGIQQGNSNAMMYLAYLNLIGLFVPQSIEKADQLILAAINTGDWRAIAFKAERLIAEQTDPAIVVQVLENGIAQGHPTLHTRLAQFALELTKQTAPASTVMPQTTPTMPQNMATEHQFAQAQTQFTQTPSHQQGFVQEQQHSAQANQDVLSDEERKMQLYEMLRQDKEKWNDVTKKSKLDFSSKGFKMMGIILAVVVLTAIVLNMMK